MRLLRPWALIAALALTGAAHAADVGHALVADSVTLSDAGTGAFFLVQKVDGQAPESDILRATQAASRGKGGFFTVVQQQRSVPASRPVKLLLSGQIGKAGPPIISLFSMARGNHWSVAGELEVQLTPNARYRVAGVLDHYRREVWLEDLATGQVVGQPIVQRADTPEDRKAMEGALYACCNLRYDGDWISDANWATTLPIIPPGARIKVTDLGSKQADVLVDGRKFRIGLDYGRKQLTMQKLLDQLLLKETPAATIATWPAAVQAAIRAGKVVLGMTRDQVVVALGPPRADETASRDDATWTYRTYRSDAFVLHFNAQGAVEKVEADKPEVVGQVLLSAP